MVFRHRVVATSGGQSVKLSLAKNSGWWSSQYSKTVDDRWATFPRGTEAQITLDGVGAYHSNGPVKFLVQRGGG